MYINVLSYCIWLGMIRLKYNSFVECKIKRKPKEKQKNFLLLFTLLTLYPYMPLEQSY